MVQFRKLSSKRTILLASSLVLATAGIGGYFIYQGQRQSQESQVNSQVDSLTVQEAVDKSKKTNLVLAGEVTANNSSKIKIDSTKGEISKL